MKYYLASPFFNEEQIEYISGLENLLKSVQLDYYSPREYGDTAKIKLPNSLNPLKRKLIFNSNIENIELCDGMIVNLLHKDMGTLFEYGYALALSIYNSDLNYELITVPEVDSYYGDANSYITEDEERSDLRLVKVNESMTYGDVYEVIRTFHFEYENSPNSDELVFAVDTTDSGTNYHLGAMILGALYYLGMPCIYISPVKSKSNLMITESGINQYLNLDDYDNSVPVVYDDSQIR